MQALLTLPSAGWSGPYPTSVQDQAIHALEQGKVLFLPNLAFALDPHELEFLSPATVRNSKNVSYDPADGSAGGTGVAGIKLQELCALMGRFAASTRMLLNQLLPDYRASIRQARTSLRPVEVDGRKTSWRKDDSRLHVDSFPSMPTHGRRILRVFSNINPHGRPRVWRVGESFENVARRFWPTLKPPGRARDMLMYLLRVTRSLRSPYDSYMLQLHDRMKQDDDYQEHGNQVAQAFPPGSTWIVYTDQVPHAAMSGIHQLEQTFYVPVASLRNQATAPIQVLEGLARRKLA
jgi:hypothetical protein